MNLAQMSENRAAGFCLRHSITIDNEAKKQSLIAYMRDCTSQTMRGIVHSFGEIEGLRIIMLDYNDNHHDSIMMEHIKHCLRGIKDSLQAP